MPREYPSSPMVGVGAVVVKKGRVLVIKRGNEPNRGQWSVPGGVLELGETLAQAAAREAWEESQVEVEIVRLLSIDELLHRDLHGSWQYHYVLIDLLARWVSGTPFPGTDALDARWVAEDTLQQLDLVPRLAPVLRAALRAPTETDRAGWPGAGFVPLWNH